jgi:hypothetical protein
LTAECTTPTALAEAEIDDDDDDDRYDDLGGQRNNDRLIDNDSDVLRSHTTEKDLRDMAT